MKTENYPAAKYVQEFMGSIRFFQDFVPWLADIAVPLYQLTQKHNTDTWNTLHVSIMRILQYHLSTSPVLGYFDPQRPHTFTTTDASDYAIGGWLGQKDDNGKTIIIAYWSRKLTPAELNYPVHEREFLAFYAFVKKFRLYLHGVPFLAYVDHRSLEYMQDQPYLSTRQVHWIQELQEFEFQVEYLPGARNTFADWLSRRPDFAKTICPSCDHTFDSKGPRVLSLSIDDLINVSDIAALQLNDPFCLELSSWNKNRTSIPSTKLGYSKLFKCTDAGLWLHKTAVVIPSGPLRLQILEYFHGRADHGHYGFKKVMESMKNLVYWPTLLDDLYLFIKSCDICQRTKAHNEKRQGLLVPLSIPDTRFMKLNIDFAAMPLSSDGFDSMAVISDKFSKIIEVIPCTSTLTAAAFAILFYKHWYLKGFGMPTAIISDRDKLFVSNFWATFCQICGIQRDISTSRHQQTDGGAEVVVRILKTAFKGLVNHDQSDWTAQLPAVQFSYNNSLHSSTGFSPFYLAYAFNPQTFPSFLDAVPSDPLYKVFAQYQTDLERAHLTLYKSQTRMENSYNQHHNPAPPFQAGDFVLLSRAGLSWDPDSEVSKKLLQPYIGPFEIISIDDDRCNVTLKLPLNMRCHPTFHQSHLRLWHSPTDHFPGRFSYANNLPPVLSDDGYDSWEVEKILDSRYRGRGKTRYRQFLVQWKGYDRSHNTWEPESFMSTCPELLAEFLQRDPVLNRQMPTRKRTHLSRGSVALLCADSGSTDCEA
jgi:hypothetical protein